MKPLILLVVVFAVALLWTLIFQGNADHVISGRIAMGVMLIFTAIGHFRFAEGMAFLFMVSRSTADIFHCLGVLFCRIECPRIEHSYSS